MATAEKLAMAAGRSRESLIQIASTACAAQILKRWPYEHVIILCGPGGNGTDGLVIAKQLQSEERDVHVIFYDPSGDGQALTPALELSGWEGEVNVFDDGFDGDFSQIFNDFEQDFIFVDALFGIGLNRALEGKVKALVEAVIAAEAPVLSVDVPSGLNGDHSDLPGTFIRADVTVTFEALKPVHLLEPAASTCGELVVVPLKLGEDIIQSTGPQARVNDPDGWSAALPWPTRSDHKHKRGRLGVISGPAGSTGAARMAALAGLRMGAGVVTMYAAPDALRELSYNNLEIMNQVYARQSELSDKLAKTDVVIVGPASGLTVETRQHVLSCLRASRKMVIDADALSVFSEDPRTLMEGLHAECVLTPHVGEFERIFPELLSSSVNRMEAVRKAQARAGCTILLKGADTIISAGQERQTVDVHGSPWLATAGSGDVLAGMIGGLMTQGMPAYEAACAAVWMHGEASLQLGPGLIAGDLISQIPAVLKSLYQQSEPGRTDRRSKVITTFS